jgi:hypothetical protein
MEFMIHTRIKELCKALPNTENAKRNMWTPDKKTGPIPAPDMPRFMLRDRLIKRYYDIEGYKLCFQAYFNSSDVFKTIEKIWLVYNEQEIALNIFEYMKLKRAVYKKYKRECVVDNNRKFLDSLPSPLPPGADDEDYGEIHEIPPAVPPDYDVRSK